MKAMRPGYKLEPGYLFPILADNLFCGLTAKSCASLAKIKQTKKFHEGETFFSAGEMPCRVYVLREGAARIVLNTAQNLTASRSIEPNEIVGLTETMANLPYEIKAEAVTSCLCECIRREDFIRFLHDEPEVCFRLVETLGLNLQKAYKFLFFSIN